MKIIAVLLIALGAVSAVPARNDIMVRVNTHGGMVCRRNCGRVNLNDCPIVECPKPPADRTCPRPVCTNGTNRQFVFPSPDPTAFYQCSPIINANGSYGWEVLERACGCQTLFSYAKQACVHPREWKSDCNATPNPPPPPRECIRECPTC